MTLEVESEEHKGIFDIAPNGDFTTKKKLDYEAGPHRYSVGITITDGVNTDSAVVEVQVTDANDNSPKFGESSYEAELDGSQTEGMLVVKVSHPPTMFSFQNSCLIC